MKNKINLFIFIEVQVILVLLVFVVFKLYSIENKVFNTNKLVFKTLLDERIQELEKNDENDIVIGSLDAPVTAVMYTKPGCIHCDDFLKNTLPQINIEFIQTGDLKLVVRYLTGPNSEDFETVLKQYRFAKENSKEDYLSLLTGKIEPDTLDFNPGDSLIIVNKYIEAKKSGIRYTPTFVIGKRLTVGNISLDKFQEIIQEQLELCE